MKLRYLLLTILLQGCVGGDLAPLRTPGERNSGYNYIPLDPLPVQAGPLTQCRSRRAGQPADIMDALPDNAVRIAIQELTASGNATFGPVVIGAGGSQYRVILDYITVDTTNLRFEIADMTGGSPSPALAHLDDAVSLSVRRLEDPDKEVTPGYDEVVIPVYVGVGLRLTALVDVRSGKLNLASLGAIAAAAEAKKTAGSLVVQTLGINGPQVASTLPLPSELNATTVQNAILSMGAIKAIIYDKDTFVSARVTGIYNPLPSSNPKLINAIVSALARTPIRWTPCEH